jgi:hypothetical protein
VAATLKSRAAGKSRCANCGRAMAETLMSISSSWITGDGLRKVESNRCEGRRCAFTRKPL